ncbi:MAG: hypothetical protein Q9210_002218 [Variospora velana]
MYDTELVELCKHLWEDPSLDDEERCEKAQSMIAELSPETGDKQMLRVWGLCRDQVQAEVAGAEKEKQQAAERAKSTPVESRSSRSYETGNSPKSKLRGDAPQFEPGRPTASLTTVQLTDDERRQAYRTRLATMQAMMSQKDLLVRNLQGQITWHTQEIGRLEMLRAELLQEVNARFSASSASNPAQRGLFSQVQEADARAAELRREKGRLMNQKKAAEEERNLLHAEMFPREGEMGPQ